MNHTRVSAHRSPRSRPSPILPLVLGLASMVAALATPPAALAFEDARVMPANVRRLSLRVVTTDIDEKTSPSGEKRPLSRPLEKNLTFKDIAKNETDPTKRNLTKGFLQHSGFQDGQYVGTFDADIRSRVTVFAPVATYGLTDTVTFAAAMPIYNMASSVGVGFRSNETGQRFVDTLANGWNNQRSSSIEASEKIGNAAQRLNDKLERNGYRRLENWKETGPGDLLLVTKWRTFDAGWVQNAVTGGVVVPTGRVDDPDNLIDKGFGDGQWDLLGQAAFDQPLGSTGLSVNQYGKYTWQLPGRRAVRLATADETIEVGKRKVDFKLGDKIDVGSSLQYGGDLGVTAGAGYNVFHKFADVYDVEGDPAAKSELQQNTMEQAHQLEVELGYSGVPAFRRGQIPVPFETKVNYKRQLRSRNMPVTHLVQLDAGVFF